MTSYTGIPTDGDTVTLPADGRDEQIARAFFAAVDRRCSADKIERAIVDYEERVEQDRPYEDATSVDDLRRSLGR